MTFGLFVSDKIKGFILTIVIGGPFTALLLKIIQVSPREKSQPCYKKVYHLKRIVLLFSFDKFKDWR